jgi:hypothetical protein
VVAGGSESPYVSSAPGTLPGPVDGNLTPSVPVPDRQLPSSPMLRRTRKPGRATEDEFTKLPVAVCSDARSWRASQSQKIT